MQDFYHFRLSKSAGMKKIVQMSATFLEATNIRIYTVLSDFEKCRDSRVKSAPQLPKIEGGGGVSQFGQCPYLDCFLFKMASLICLIKTAIRFPMPITQKPFLLCLIYTLARINKARLLVPRCSARVFCTLVLGQTI